MNIQRLLIIDKCLRDRSRSWSLQDLIDACSETESNSRRSVQADIELMRKGYSAPITVVDRKYYTYKDEKYTLLKQNLTELDIKNLLIAVTSVQHYLGFAQMKGVDVPLYNLHDKIAQSLELPRPTPPAGIKIANERKAPKGELVRLWINESIADEIRNNPIHSSQRIEQEEIDGSVNVKLNMPITQELEYFILQHESNIKIHEPAELIAQIKKLKSTMLF